MFNAPEVLLLPGICFLCERSRDEGERWVDTHRWFDPGHPSKLTGRKYVCDRCALDLARFYGFSDNLALEQANIRADKAEKQLKAIRFQVEGLSGHIREEILSGSGEVEVGVGADQEPTVRDTSSAPAKKWGTRRPKESA